jgi:flagellar hook-basal body complex protein FliE
MTIEALMAIQGATSERVPEMQAGLRSAPPSTGFESWLTAEITEVDARIHRADDAVRSLALGEDVPLHGVMLSLERAKSSFEFVVQVRNRLLEGYQEVMRMQI